MTKKKWPILTYIVPIVALIVVASQIFLVNTSRLNKWKGGGFGMYSEVHYYYNELIVTNLNKPIDSLILTDRRIAAFAMDVKRQPNDENLRHMAELASKYATSDTINVQIWRPLVDAKNSRYSRELMGNYQYIKP